MTGARNVKGGLVLLSTGLAAGLGMSLYAFQPLVPSMKAAEKARKPLIGILVESCPHTLGVSMLTLFMTGKKRTLPSGTTQVRVVVPPKLPTKNHTEPRCPTTHLSPVASSCGISDTGNESPR